MHISRHVKLRVTSEKSRAQHIEEAQQRYEEFSALRPPFLVAVREDAKVFCANRGEPYEFKTRWGEFFNILRLLWAADDFLGLTIYRLRSSLHAAKVPILPRLLEFVHTIAFGIRIGDKVILREGIYLPHGQIALGGVTLIGRRCYLAWDVGIGVVPGSFLGPVIEDNVFIGTGTRILGDFTVGEGAIIGANAAVMREVPPHSRAAGVPARILEERAPADEDEGPPPA